MLLAAVQTDIHFANVQANLERTLEWLQLAGRENADLVVFPECMLSGYGYDEREHAREHARDIHDPLFDSLAAAASANRTFLSIGFLEKANGAVYNAAALIGGEGVIGHYRKVHLPHLGVDRFVDRGNRPYEVLPAGRAKVGMAICYDSSFPEPMRVLGLAGADIIALGTNWPAAAERTAAIVPPARSMENHLYFVAANRVGTENGFQFCGRSSICGPDGIVLAQSCDDAETMLLGEADLQLARNKRIERTPGTHVIDRFQDRCPQFYGEIVQPKPPRTSSDQV